jgi:hypothetical protein
MSTKSDPLIKPPGVVDRLHYAVGVLLDDEDFRAEQSYHRARLARALAYLHGSGTVAGLHVPPISGDDEQLLVQPGLAVDRLGRQIELQRPACIRVSAWFSEQEADELNRATYDAPFPGVTLPDDVVIAQGVVADLFIRFVVCERGKTPAFAAGPFNALDAVEPSRLRDGYELSLVLRQNSAPLPAPPWPEVETTDLAAFQRTARAALLNAWREGTAFNRLGDLNPLPEHVEGQDPSALFLARLVIPATRNADLSAPPTRTGQPIQVSSEARSLVYPTSLLVKGIGI